MLCLPRAKGPVAIPARREEDDARGAALRDARGPDQRAESHRCGPGRAVVQGPRAGARRVGVWGYPLVNVYIAMENHHFQWVNPLFQWLFSIAMLVYQRVNEG